MMSPKNFPSNSQQILFLTKERIASDLFFSCYKIEKGNVVVIRAVLADRRFALLCVFVVVERTEQRTNSQ